MTVIKADISSVKEEARVGRAVCQEHSNLSYHAQGQAGEPDCRRGAGPSTAAPWRELLGKGVVSAAGRGFPKEIKLQKQEFH